MDIPACYDPIAQAERLALEQDKLMENTEQCHICHRTLYPGDTMHVASFIIVCPSCFEELADNLEIV